ncbi:MAG: hypothetical protein WCF22_03835 [Candidatus Sulfotelmatobacter sp.]
MKHLDFDLLFGTEVQILFFHGAARMRQMYPCRRKLYDVPWFAIAVHPHKASRQAEGGRSLDHTSAASSQPLPTRL